MHSTPAPYFVVVLPRSRGLWLALSGLAVGVGAGLAAGRGFAALVFGVSPYDATTYLAIAGGTIAFSLASCFLPARRAASVNPIDLLRSA